uniref:Putative secreted protein n=1 Tax=Anopheles darlingi TaxID=43151 RepID=A0A2M4DC09_ANODA
MCAALLPAVFCCIVPLLSVNGVTPPSYRAKFVCLIKLYRSSYPAIICSMRCASIRRSHVVDSVAMGD